MDSPCEHSTNRLRFSSSQSSFILQSCSVHWRQQPRLLAADLPSVPTLQDWSPPSDGVTSPPAPPPPGTDVCVQWILSQILIVFYAPVHSVYKGKTPLLLALYTRQPSLTEMCFPTGTDRCKVKVVFCYLECKKIFYFSCFLPSPR